MSQPATAPALPCRPRVVLRAGFAGHKELTPNERNRLEQGLGEVLGTLAHRLAAVAPGVPVDIGTESRVSRFYAPQCPLLRLVTGLCEGADALAAQVLERVRNAPDPSAVCVPETRCLETELAAVLPFDVADYRQSRPEGFRAEFDRQLAGCGWVLALDGIYDRPDVVTLAALPQVDQMKREALAKNRRARAYRAQSAFLLRHSDLLIAAANPDDPSNAGGTLETVRAALAFELPVVFLHTGTGEVYLIEPQDDLHSVLAEKAPRPERWKATLCQWVSQLTTDPDSGLDPADPSHRTHEKHGEALLQEFFHDSATPPRDAAGEQKTSWREKVWISFEKRFRSGPESKSDPKLQPYSAYRSRATELNRHYSGLYRGAFLLNYVLAIVAVTLAAASLALLGTAGHTGPGEEAAVLAQAAGLAPAQTPAPVAPRGWLVPTLLGFAVLKLAILISISRNTRRANRENWNDRAVDYRYLAERLRGMFYLPQAGSHQPPAAAPPQFASRVVRQSAVDWLFDSIVRAISPANLPLAQAVEIPAHDGTGTVRVKKLLTLQPRQMVENVRDAWVGEQTKYHERNARTMHALHHSAERVAACLGWTVIGIVALDFLVIGGELMHWLPHAWEPKAKLATPWLVFISAVLPAVVAALNGIRFQSECQRLAERSAVMRVMLHGRSAVAAGEPQGRWQQADDLARRIAATQASPDDDPGSWAHDALRLTERVATDFVQEAAEWSVLYAKEVSDPG